MEPWNQLFRLIWLSQVMLGVIAGCMIVLLVSFGKLCILLTKRGVKFAKVLLISFRNVIALTFDNIKV